MFLVQPQPANYSEYLDFAEKNGLGFEVTDFMFPSVLDDKNAVTRLYERFKNAPAHSLHGVFIDLNYSGGDPEIFKISEKRIRQCVKAAVKLNAPRIVLHSCFFPVLTPNDVLYELWSEESGTLLKKIAAEFDVCINIENVLDQTPDIILKMLEYTKEDKRIGVCLDVGHANLTRTPIEAWVDAFGANIKHVHLSDNMGLYDDHIALGDGTSDLDTFFDKIKKLGIKPDFTIEVKPFENVVKSWEYLKNKGFAEGF